MVSNSTDRRVARRLVVTALAVAALSVPQKADAQLPVTLCASFDTSLCFDVHRPRVADFLQSLRTDQLVRIRPYIDGVLNRHGIGPIPDEWYRQDPPGPVFVVRPTDQRPPTSVLEPPVWLMTATGLLGVAVVARRRRGAL